MPCRFSVFFLISATHTSSTVMPSLQGTGQPSRCAASTSSPGTTGGLDRPIDGRGKRRGQINWEPEGLGLGLRNSSRLPIRAARRPSQGTVPGSWAFTTALVPLVPPSLLLPHTHRSGATQPIFCPFPRSFVPSRSRHPPPVPPSHEGACCATYPDSTRHMSGSIIMVCLTRLFCPPSPPPQAQVRVGYTVRGAPTGNSLSQRLRRLPWACIWVWVCV